MNYSLCGISSYLGLCASLKIIMLVPGFGLNLFVLASLVSSLCGHQSHIKRNVAAFVLGSTLCNLVNLAFWPLTIHWKTHGRWLLGEQVCEIMVKTKHFAGSASFHYVSFISFSVYLTVVWGQGRLVDSGTFLALQLFLPFVPVLIKEIYQWGGRIEHLDPIELTCFSYITDWAIRVLLLWKLVFFIPLNLYFYAHILVTIYRSAKQMQRSQMVNKKLAKIFSVISLITLTTHLPGGVLSLMDEHSVCQETTKEFLMDLPLLSSPIVLLCTNKELRSHCLTPLRSKMGTCRGSKCAEHWTRSIKTSDNARGDTVESQIPTTVKASHGPGRNHPTTREGLTTELPHIYVHQPGVAMEMRHVNGHLPAELHFFPTSSKHKASDA